MRAYAPTTETHPRTDLNNCKIRVVKFMSLEVNLSNPVAQSIPWRHLVNSGLLEQAHADVLSVTNSLAIYFQVYDVPVEHPHRATSLVKHHVLAIGHVDTSLIHDGCDGLVLVEVVALGEDRAYSYSYEVRPGQNSRYSYQATGG